MPAFSVTFRAISVKAAADIRISSLFEANADVDGLGFFFDAIATNDFYKTIQNPHAPYVLREGNGLRISLLAHGVSLKSSVSFAAVAAEAQLNQTRVEYEVTGIGITMDVIKSVLSLKGDLSLELTAKLDDIVADKLPRMLTTSGLPPERYSVPRPPLAAAHEDPSIRSRTVAYAMAAIASGKSLARASALRPSWASDALVTATYARVTPGTKFDEKPKPERQMKASTWLSTGQQP